MPGGVGLSLPYLVCMAVRRFGGGPVLIASAVAAACGLAVVPATGSLLAAGLPLVGVALPPGAPAVHPLTARATPGRSGQAISVVTAAGYLAFTQARP